MQIDKKDTFSYKKFSQDVVSGIQKIHYIKEKNSYQDINQYHVIKFKITSGYGVLSRFILILILSLMVTYLNICNIYATSSLIGINIAKAIVDNTPIQISSNHYMSFILKLILIILTIMKNHKIIKKIINELKIHSENIFNIDTIF